MPSARKLLGPVARRVVRRLPEGARQRLGAANVEQLYRQNTAGLGTPPAFEDRRPVSIVIPSYNDLPYLTACLASIRETCAGFEYEVLIVDDYIEPENTRRLLELQDERTRVILKDRRLGFAGNVNVGMREARYDIVLLNSDIVAKAGWLDALQARAYSSERIGMVSPKLVYPDGRIQYAGTYYARVLAPQWFGHFHVGSPATRPSANVPGYNRSISGACVYIKKPVYDELGGLDEQFWLGFEDVDYGLRAWQSGVRCYYEPAALLVHHESATRGYSQGARELASMRYFWRRWQQLFLTRRLEARPALDYVVSTRAEPLWARYVHEQADAMVALGYDARVHTSDTEDLADEAIVAELAERESVKIATDRRVAETVWVSSLHRGKPLYLLPGMETLTHGDDPALQARIVAGYRPEFDYVAPNRWTADQVRAEAAWEVAHRLVPALTVAPFEAVGEPDASRVCCVGDGGWCEVVDDVADLHGARVTHLRTNRVDDEVLARIAEERPGVIVSSLVEEQPLSVFAFMAGGAAVIAGANDHLRYEVLDGYNALTPVDGESDPLRIALDSVLSDGEIRRELADNGRHSARRFSEGNSPAMARIIEAVAATSV
ncbi:glycosyltransferase family 2 protein [Agromyces silvae]|uniref:glycosyltransferase family 2 protein n=1 Tax=Agromyces silvae TaxID=3388266 RepID=UPI00280AAF51|nr:glycosyltransferase family 2 protein [Agromyces protaetiae]